MGFLWVAYQFSTKATFKATYKSTFGKIKVDFWKNKSRLLKKKSTYKRPGDFLVDFLKNRRLLLHVFSGEKKRLFSLIRLISRLMVFHKSTYKSTFFFKSRLPVLLVPGQIVTFFLCASTSTISLWDVWYFWIFYFTQCILVRNVEHFASQARFSQKSLYLLYGPS